MNLNKLEYPQSNFVQPPFQMNNAKFFTLKNSFTSSLVNKLSYLNFSKNNFSSDNVFALTLSPKFLYSFIKK